MGSGEGGHRLAMALETGAGFQFVGHQLEVGRFLERNELLEEGGISDVDQPLIELLEKQVGKAFCDLLF